MAGAPVINPSRGKKRESTALRGGGFSPFWIEFLPENQGMAQTRRLNQISPFDSFFRPMVFLFCGTQGRSHGRW
jgi:hypothetical protein